MVKFIMSRLVRPSIIRLVMPGKHFGSEDLRCGNG